MDWMKIGSAILLIMFAVMIFPSVIHQVKHGPKGNSKQWLNVSVLLAGVVLFVVFLIKMV